MPRDTLSHAGDTSGICNTRSNAYDNSRRAYTATHFNDPRCSHGENKALAATGATRTCRRVASSECVSINEDYSK